MTLKKEHIHKWRRTTKWVIPDKFLDKLFNPIYKADIAKCKCGEWYYIL